MSAPKRLTGAEVIRGLKEGTVERRAHTGVYSRRRQSKGVVICPFCWSELEVYPWSFADSGKRCDCGALVKGGYAYHWAAEVEEQ